MADGIHITERSNNISVVSNTVTDTGDDGIATVSYKKDKDYCSDIVIRNNLVRGGLARGISCVGSQRTFIYDNRVYDKPFAGILVCNDGSYDTMTPN